jgi:GTP diphosphokinase / guanosine-3',5'-bis(diphosphate) 3'-diphosphatase
MNRKEFFEKLPYYFSKKDRVRIVRAYWLAKEVHRSQKRDGGERYFEHCRRVACFLIDYGPTNADEIITALLHDCVEDGFIPADLLTMLFGQPVADAIDALSKVTLIFNEHTGAIKEKTKKDTDEYWQIIAKSPAWIRRVKLADRMDNINDMDVWSKERQWKYIAETKKYILPIARATDFRFTEALQTKCENYQS